MKITCAMCGAECWTDHKFVKCILKLCTYSLTQWKHPKVIRSPFNIVRLRHPYHYNRFWEALNENLKASAPHMLKTALRSGVSLRRSSLKQQKLSWVLRNMNIRIDLKRMMNVSLSCYMWTTWPMWSGKITWAPNPKLDKFRHLRGQAKKQLHEMKNHWWDRKADEVQKYADSNNSKQFFRALKTVYGPTHDLDPPIYYQLMDQHWSRTRRLWKNDGQNILATYWTDLHQSAPLHLTRSLSSPL